MIAHALKRAAAVAMIALLAACQAVLVHEVRSQYSLIQVVDYGLRRAMIFAGDTDHRAVETLIDLRQPHRLQHPYARTMMAGLIYQPDPAATLLIGLGGGALVRFLNHHYPDMALDVVEIDPVVVSVAREYFGTTSGPRTRILVDDGAEYLRRAAERYDLILMDAHLHPSEDTDRAGQPLRLKTKAFLQSVRDRLRGDGVVLFNMIESDETARYIEDIRAAFPFVEVLRPTGSGNIIVAATLSAAPPPESTLRERAGALDRSDDHGFSFERLLEERRGR